jgi:hypothetical protein
MTVTTHLPAAPAVIDGCGPNPQPYRAGLAFGMNLVTARASDTCQTSADEYLWYISDSSARRPAGGGC